MRKLNLTSALIAACLSGSAIAEDWVKVAVNESSNEFFIDRDTIRTLPNGYKRAWGRGVYAKPSAGGNIGHIVYEEYECREGSKRTLQLSFLKPGGDREYVNLSNPQPWRYVEPGSIPEIVFNFVCFGKLSN